MNGCLGDAIMTLPLIELLESRWPRIWIMAPGYPESVLSTPNRTFLPYLPGKGPASDFKRADALKREGFDAAILCSTSFRSAWFTRLAGIPKRIGHSVEGRSFLLTDPVKFEDSAYYAFSQLDLARPLGFAVRLARPRLALPSGTPDVQDLLRGAVIGVQPGAAYEDKRIATDLLAASIRRLNGLGLSVVLLGGREERTAADRLCEQLDVPVLDLVGKTDMKTLIGVLAALRLMIGGDTGVLHLAAALGTTTVQVFGPTVYKGWGNVYGANQAIVAPGGDIKRLAQADMDAAVDAALVRREAVEVAIGSVG